MEPLAEWTYSCTEEEIYRCLKRGELRRAGPVRVGIQTAVLLLLTAYCLIGYFTGDRSDARPLVVGILAAMLAIILLFVPDGGSATTRHGRRRSKSRCTCFCSSPAGVRHAGGDPPFCRMPSPPV